MCSWDRGGRVAVIRAFIKETHRSERNAGRYVHQMGRQHGRCVQPLRSKALCAARERQTRVYTERILSCSHGYTRYTHPRTHIHIPRHNNPVCVSPTCSVPGPECQRSPRLCRGAEGRGFGGVSGYMGMAVWICEEDKDGGYSRAVVNGCSRGAVSVSA